MIIVANALLRRYRDLRKSIIAYADDFGIVKGGNTRVELENNANNTIEIFGNICDDLQLRISAQKCIAIMMGKNTLENRRPIFKLNNISIPVSDNILT